MPELPEVETIRRQLVSVLPGRRVEHVEIWDPRLTLPDDPERIEQALIGRTVRDVGRRGKYLLMEFDGSDILVVHLRMTGQLYFRSAEPLDDPPYPRAQVTFSDGASLLYCDLRRFGRAWLVPRAVALDGAYWHGRVGVEPLDVAFTARALGRCLDGRRTPIKAALLNQALVAGIGNIYADEALFAARIHPETEAGALDDPGVRRLHRAIRDRLRVAIDAGGSSIDRYRDVRGERGAMQTLLRVHLRRGEPCVRCGTAIEKIRVAQRGTYVCPRCQPAPC